MKNKPYEVKNMGWNVFVGKTVSKLEMNEDKSVMRFTMLDGAIFYVSAVGDCCSNSWFEHIEGEDALLGYEVLRVVEREMPKAIDKTNGDLTQFYGWTLETSRGRFDVEMRNESNGCYGGKAIVSDVVSDQDYCEIENGFENRIR